MKLICLLLLNLIIIQSAFGQNVGSNEGRSINKSFSNKYGTRSYDIFEPSKLADKPGLIVVLHGCFMTGLNMAVGTELNPFAFQRNFIVVYPEQTTIDNVWKCWNWFKPDNQKRDDGEASIIAGITEEVIKSYNVDTQKVIVTGLSAGSAMAANLIGCYSDLYTGALLQSGLEFAAAQSESEAHNVTANGPSRSIDEAVRLANECSPNRKNLIPIVVVHGDSDPYVNIVNGQRTAEVFEKINTQVFIKNGGDISKIGHKVIELNQDGYKFSAVNTQTLYDSVPVVEKIIVQKMGHGWSGGNSVAPYMEPRGIKATQILVDKFFPIQ